jgi:mRNA interferase HigB
MLREFWESRKHDAETAERDLMAWLTVANEEDWANFAAIKQTFGSADRVGNCVVFDVGNNRFRLIARINHRKGIIYTLRVMDHPEYNKKKWVDDCRCHEPPPKKKG